MNRLQDKVAIVTGGAQGIGQAIVEQYLREGARVAIWDLLEEKGLALASSLDPSGEKVRFFSVDVANYEQVEAQMQATHAAFGRIDILVNNAGITRDSSLKKMSMEQWQKVIEVNLNGVFYCVKAVYPIMAAQMSGRIINASSVVGIQGNFGQTNYVATKAGVIGMTKVWAREFGRKNITVNAIAPGFIATEMITTIPDAILDSMKGRSPLNRLGSVDEVASAYTFLASDEAAFITGTTLSVDGGISI